MQKQAWRLQWSERFEVGVAALDADHRELVRLIDAACSAAQQGQRAELLAILGQTVELAAAHFEREEAVLKTIPGIERELTSHAKGHERNIERLTTIRQSLSSGDGLGDVDQLCSELIDWFVRQAVGHDSKIRGYFHNGR
ncbi:MAG: bacteriohemerythrin [Kiloniellales bacterium]